MEGAQSNPLQEWLVGLRPTSVKVVMPDIPAPGTDWQAQDGYGWIFKAWFRSRKESRDAEEAIRGEGWGPLRARWGRKVRVLPTDGYDGQRLAEFVVARWPEARIQLRND